MNLFKFNFKYIKDDLFGGITAGVVALPLALAFGVQSGMGAEAGLYGAIILGFLAAMFGGTSTQVSGPTGPMTVVSAVLIATAVSEYGGLENAIGVILLTFLLAGAIQIVLGVLKVGQYIKFIPYPVVSGFMSGIGVIIIILQIFPFFGKASPKKITDIILNIGTALTDINWFSVIIATLTIGVIYLFPKITKAIPSTLVAIIIMPVVTLLLGWEVPKIGDIPRGLPELKISSFLNFGLGDIPTVLMPAITLAALGAIDSLLTSVVADNLTKTRHNSDKELVGQGIGNMVSSIFGGIPGAGATMRTVVNINAGGKTRISGMVHGLFLLVVLLGLGTLASEIPLSVLAGILITVGIGIIDYKGFRHIRSVPKSDSIIMLIVLVATVFVDLLQAVGIGMVLATFLFMKKMSEMSEEHTTVKNLDDYQNENNNGLKWEDEKELTTDFLKKVYIKHLYGPIFFGFSSSMKNFMGDVEGIDYFVFRFERVPFVDQSGLYALEDIIEDLKKQGAKIFITGLNERTEAQLRKIDFMPSLIEEEHVYDDFDDCIMDIKNEMKKENGILVEG
ncbi:SulP family inorganic anion transporter [Membranihabitans maritimus]|uniref:SulP family inorganic anion transporter n=1 Tax=Membranihabitans maritimus TaxID=2904244 RepID=UPI001F381A2A|nr:SulP family inorganic anion transporter [Membranihabitans maritimus]